MPAMQVDSDVPHDVKEDEQEVGKYYVFSAYYKHGDTNVKAYETEEALREAGIKKYKEAMEEGDPNGDEDQAAGYYRFEHDDKRFLERAKTMSLGEFVDVVIDRSLALKYNEAGWFWVRVIMGLEVCDKDDT